MCFGRTSGMDKEGDPEDVADDHFAGYEAGLGAEDLTMEVFVGLEATVGTDAIASSPENDQLVDDLQGTTAVWGSSPMSPLQLLSPNQANNFFGTPTKEQGAIYSQLSPLRPSWNALLASPSRPVLASPSRPVLASPNPRGTVLLNSGNADAQFSSNFTSDGQEPAQGLSWQEIPTPEKEEPGKHQQRGKQYKRLVQLSDFIAASNESSLEWLQASASTNENVPPARQRTLSAHIMGSSDRDPRQSKRTRLMGLPTVGRGTPAKATSHSIERRQKSEPPTKASGFETPPQWDKETEDKPRSCHCKKSQCLKLYCDCFAAGGRCGPECKCESCLNTDDHAAEIEAAVKRTLERNPFAFDPKFERERRKGVSDSDKENAGHSHTRGCNCRKSGCLKKYCECYNAGVPCGSKCKCHECQNRPHGDPESHGEMHGCGHRTASSVYRSPLARRLDFDEVAAVTEADEASTPKQRDGGIIRNRHNLSFSTNGLLPTGVHVSAHKPPVARVKPRTSSRMMFPGQSRLSFLAGDDG